MRVGKPSGRGVPVHARLNACHGMLASGNGSGTSPRTRPAHADACFGTHQDTPPGVLRV